MYKPEDTLTFRAKMKKLRKKDTLAARRRAFAILCDHAEVSQLFGKVAPRFKSRKGGYTRIIPYIQRGGDNAELAFLELTEKTREIITNQKRVKAVKEAGDTTKVSEAETKPVAPAVGTAPSVATTPTTHSKADVKSTPKAAAKPAGIRKLFQRKIGSE